MTLRIKYTKEKYMKFLGHLELLKLFERIFRLHQYPLKFSEGFNPRPKMTFASPLSVGYASKGEVMEVVLDEMMPLENVMNTKFPDGIEVLDAIYVDTKKSLMASIHHSEYLIKVELNQNVSEIAMQFEHFINQENIWYKKKSKKGTIRDIDAKPQLISSKMIYSEENEFVIRCQLQTSSQGNLNPETLIQCFLEYLQLDGQAEAILVERLAMFTDDGTSLFEMQ